MIRSTNIMKEPLTVTCPNCKKNAYPLNSNMDTILKMHPHVIGEDIDGYKIFRIKCPKCDWIINFKADGSLTTPPKES